MRFVVLLFGLLGVALTGIVGAMFLLFLKVFLTSLADNGIDKLVKENSGFDVADFIYTSPTGLPNREAGLLLLIAAGLAFLGTVLSFARCGWQGALLLVIPFICSTITNPVTAPFTAPLLLAGMASFLVFPRPINPPKPADADEDDD
ncbi:MAG: hypothetical protein HY289_03835 [Planctomycetes bacterium]|nr:hypothetical protein [Planctomycetota bacterium]